MDHPHRRRCRSCGEYAAALERAASAGRRGTVVPLPDRLRRRLEAVPAAPAQILRFPVPQARLPERLRGRLQGLAAGDGTAQADREPPYWVRSSRYAVAASYLLAALTFAAFGDPVAQGRRALAELAQEIAPSIESAELHGRDRLEALESAAASRYHEARRSLETSFASLGSRVTELSQTLFSTERRTR
jgi:hypothetical protein